MIRSEQKICVCLNLSYQKVFRLGNIVFMSTVSCCKSVVEDDGRKSTFTFKLSLAEVYRGVIEMVVFSRKVCKMSQNCENQPKYS